MSKSISHRRIYENVIKILESTPLPRGGLVEQCLKRTPLSKEELSDMSAGSAQNNMRSRIGTVINEMHAAALIGLDEDGRYYLISARPVAIRVERCEREIIKALSEGAKTKAELRDVLKAAFGTDKTATTRDDDTLFTYMGQILKRLQAQGVITLEGGVFALSARVFARADDINALLTLKTDFIKRLHSKGGEFFENYFMQLLKRYMEKHGRRVLECYVTGGSADGGIDGVIKIEDSLGFRETVMVQTKNRLEMPTETDVRGFYGAVCAKRGTRGIYATTSDFHSGASAFLEELDDCVPINGDRIFRMAIECSYGIKKSGGAHRIDEKII